MKPNQKSAKKRAKRVDVNDLIRKSEAARLRNCKRPAITYHIHEGNLRTYEVGGTEFVLRSQVLKLKDKRKVSRAA